MKVIASPNRVNGLILLISAIIITNFLFFIDEGYYDFRWMSDAGNWIPFFIYLVVIFILQLVFSDIILKKYHGKNKTILSILEGAVIGLILLVLIFS